MYESKYKDRPAVIIEGNNLIATFLPQDGGKLASLRVRSTGKELLAVKPEEKYKVLTYDGNYCSAECSGFDDMFPTVDPITPTEGDYQGITYPDHGETCRIAYDVKILENSVIFNANSKIFPLDYQKIVRVAQDGGLDIEYHINNHGDAPLPSLWAGHIMLQGDDGIRVFTPFDDNTLTTMMFGPKDVPESSLPHDHLIGYQPGIGATYKFYYLDPMPEGRFGLSYPDGSKLTFEVDPNKVPYLGIWFNNGAFQNLYSITPEPCTIPYDAPDRAAEHGYTFTIPANSRFSFNMHISWDEKSNM